MDTKAPIYLYNTLSREREIFAPLTPELVRMYHCGPTVYDYQHIGNMRAFVFADTLKRVFLYNGYVVEQVINITDVGHLASDEDEGEDKMEKGAAREGKGVQEIAEYYTRVFMEDLARLNVNTEGTQFPRATEHIAEQIALIEVLEKKGHVYKTSDGMYFDSSTYPEYGVLARLDIKGLQEGARVEKNPEKRNPTDFAVWKFLKGGVKREQVWDAPWGAGFPGWHIECSAMAMKYLGTHFDIHTGGVDHIPVHHTNEIAQAECATGKKFVNYWMHEGHVLIGGEKMSKSLGNFLTIHDLLEKGFAPLSYRFWLLGADFKKTINFTFEALTGAQKGLIDLKQRVLDLGTEEGAVDDGYQRAFTEAINGDLNTAKGVAVLWELMKDGRISRADKLATVRDFDRALGLNLTGVHDELVDMIRQEAHDVPAHVLERAAKRAKAREEKNWARADEIRAEIETLGYEVKDTPEGTKFFKKK